MKKLTKTAMLTVAFPFLLLGILLQTIAAGALLYANAVADVWTQ